MKYDYTGLCQFDHVLQVASEGKKNPPSAFSASKQASLAWLVPWIGCSRILIRGRLLTRLLSYVENLPTGNVQFRSTLKFHFAFCFGYQPVSYNWDSLLLILKKEKRQNDNLGRHT